MPGAPGLVSECVRHVCNAALKALLIRERAVEIKWPKQKLAEALEEVQDMFDDMGLPPLEKDPNGAYLRLPDKNSVEVAKKLLRLHKEHYDFDYGLQDAVKALAYSKAELKRMDPQDRRYARALLVAEEGRDDGEGVLAVFPYLQREEWELLDSMRRKVAAGDLAFTDGWGAYLIVQAKMISEEPGKKGGQARAQKRRKNRDMAAKNLDRWNEFHPEAAVVLSAAFSNVDGLEFVEAAPNSGILLAALRALQSERAPPDNDRGDARSASEADSAAARTKELKRRYARDWHDGPPSDADDGASYDARARRAHAGEAAGERGDDPGVAKLRSGVAKLPLSGPLAKLAESINGNGGADDSVHGGRAPRGRREGSRREGPGREGLGLEPRTPPRRSGRSAGSSDDEGARGGRGGREACSRGDRSDGDYRDIMAFEMRQHDIRPGRVQPLASGGYERTANHKECPPLSSLRLADRATAGRRSGEGAGDDEAGGGRRGGDRAERYGRSGADRGDDVADRTARHCRGRDDGDDERYSRGHDDDYGGRGDERRDRAAVAGGNDERYGHARDEQRRAAAIGGDESGATTARYARHAEDTPDAAGEVIVYRSTRRGADDDAERGDSRYEGLGGGDRAGARGGERPVQRDAGSGGHYERGPPPPPAPGRHDDRRGPLGGYDSAGRDRRPAAVERISGRGAVERPGGGDRAPAHDRGAGPERRGEPQERGSSYERGVTGGRGGYGGYARGGGYDRGGGGGGYERGGSYNRTPAAREAPAAAGGGAGGGGGVYAGAPEAPCPPAAPRAAGFRSVGRVDERGGVGGGGEGRDGRGGDGGSSGGGYIEVYDAPGAPRGGAPPVPPARAGSGYGGGRDAAPVAVGGSQYGRPMPAEAPMRGGYGPPIKGDGGGQYPPAPAMGDRGYGPPRVPPGAAYGCRDRGAGHGYGPPGGGRGMAFSGGRGPAGGGYGGGAGGYGGGGGYARY